MNPHHHNNSATGKLHKATEKMAIICFFGHTRSVSLTEEDSIRTNVFTVLPELG